MTLRTCCVKGALMVKVYLVWVHYFYFFHEHPWHLLLLVFSPDASLWDCQVQLPGLRTLDILGCSSLYKPLSQLSWMPSGGVDCHS